MEFDEPFPELSAANTSHNLNCDNFYRKKSWTQILQTVKDSRKLQSSLTSKVPHFFSFYQCNGYTRLYFIGVPEGKKDNTIMCADITSDGKPIAWKEVLEAGDKEETDQALSKEEQLLQERRRLSLRGVTNYVLDDKSGRIVFQATSKLHTCIIQSNSDSSITPITLDTISKGSKMNPKICPSNSDFIAYIASGDIWLYDLFTKTDQRLTYSRKGNGGVLEDPISSGVPSYVIQEEFERFTGYWWSPIEHEDGVYRILYEEVNESNVDVILTVSAVNEDHGVEPYRYPRAGASNAISTLKLIEISYHSGKIDSVILDLHTNLKVLYPWMEYLVRVGWMADGQRIWVQIVDRSQTKIALVLIPLAFFVYDTEQPVPDYAFPQTIHEEKSQVWINVSHCLFFLPPSLSIDPRLMQFIWASESTGFAHLYLCSYNTSTKTSSPPVPLTYGEWQVFLDQPIHVDLVKGYVYFMGNKDTPLESHLYCTSLVNGHIFRLTQSNFSHQVTMNDDCTLLISNYSSIETNLSSRLFKIVHKNGAVSLEEANTILEQSELDPSYKPPQIMRCPLDHGKLSMYAMVYKPHNYQSGHKYPTVLFVYGGPHLQLVSNTNKALRMLKLHTLASMGYAVVCIDGRGSSGRGVLWESRLKDRMGTVEIADQVEGLLWLADALDYIDINRVAIHGWSYGGYISLMGLIQRPDIFKVAISCAPVTKWQYYDTGYTERYMSTPEQNPEGYKNGSVLSYINKFPDEENKLLLVHGMMDENVHLVHTTSLVNELLKECKPHKLQLYPNERHGIRNSEASQHFETMVISFLQDNL